MGPGLFESAYQECLFYELINQKLNVVKEKPMPIIYKEVNLYNGYPINLLVNNKAVIEVKTIGMFTIHHFTSYTAILIQRTDQTETHLFNNIWQTV